jgi:hypothetical protein
MRYSEFALALTKMISGVQIFHGIHEMRYFSLEMYFPCSIPLDK